MARVKGATRLLKRAMKKGGEEDVKFLERFYKVANLEAPQSKSVRLISDLLGCEGSEREGVELVAVFDLESRPDLVGKDFGTDVYKRVLLSAPIAYDMENKPSEWAYFLGVYNVSKNKLFTKKDLPLSYEHIIVLLERLYPKAVL